MWNSDLFKIFLITTGFGTATIISLLLTFKNLKEYLQLKQKQKVFLQKPLSLAELREQLIQKANQNQSVIASIPDVYFSGIIQPTKKYGQIISHVSPDTSFARRIVYMRHISKIQNWLDKKQVNGLHKFSQIVFKPTFLKKCNIQTVPAVLLVDDHKNEIYLNLSDNSIFGKNSNNTTFCEITKDKDFKKYTSIPNEYKTMLSKQLLSDRYHYFGWHCLQYLETGIRFNSELQVLGDVIYNAQTNIIRCQNTPIIGQFQDIKKYMEQKLMKPLLNALWPIPLLVYSFFFFVIFADEFSIELQKFKKIIKTDLNYLKKIYIEKTTTLQCLYCKERLRNVVVFPCQHLNLCKLCVSRITDKKCPQCKQEIQKMIDILN